MYSGVTLSNEEGESGKAEKEDEKSEDIFEFLFVKQLILFLKLVVLKSELLDLFLEIQYYCCH